MTELRMIGAGIGIFSVLLSGPALAASDGYGMHHRGYASRLVHPMPAPGFGTANSTTYDPWRSGPYGDGNYPGYHDDWMRLPPSAHGG